MNIKAVSIVVILVIIIGSFGAVGTHSNIERNLEQFNNSDPEIKETSKKYPTGLNLADDWYKNVSFDPCPGGSLPSEFDWRYEVIGSQPKCKNQGGCGSCWAFSTAGVLEWNIVIKHHEYIDLSEQWLVSCNRNNWGCWGADHPNAFDYYKDKAGKCGHAGAVLEDDFPYTGTTGTCNGNYNHEYFIDDWSYIGSHNTLPSVSSIKQAIYDYGPVSVGVAVNDAFFDYDGGIFIGPQSNDLNHAVVLVGWKDMGLSGYWILRNSWGTEWGEDGYMRIKYGTSKVGYAASYIKYTPDGLYSPDIIELGPAKAGTTVSASFILKNGGDKTFNWKFDKIMSFTDWGDWTFIPSSGSIPIKGQRNIVVSLRIKDGHGWGDHTFLIKFVNENDESDYAYVPVKLHIIEGRQTNQLIILRFLDNFPILRTLFFNFIKH